MRQQTLNAFKGDDKKKNEIEELMKMLDTATSDILIATDWNSNMAIVDALNNCQSQEILKEFVRQVRKKLQSRSLKSVSYALTLTETIVKNCGSRVHREVGTQKFMAQMEKLARTYVQSSDRDALEVCDKSLDIVQAWGEAFLPKRNEFPLFIDTYHSLKREGLPFRTAQYDENRAPIFTPEASAPANTGGLGAGGAGITAASEPTHELQILSESCAEALTSLIENASSNDALMEDDLAKDLMTNSRDNEGQLMILIDECCQTNPEAIEGLFASLEKLQKAVKMYEDVCSGALVLPIQSSSRSSPPLKQSPSPAPVLQEQAEVGLGSHNIPPAVASDFLGLGSSGSVPSQTPPLAASAPAAAKPVPKLAPPPDRRMPKLAPSSRDMASRRTAKDKPRKSPALKSEPAPEIDLLGGLTDEIAAPTPALEPVSDPFAPQQPSAAAPVDVFQTAPAGPTKVSFQAAVHATVAANAFLGAGGLQQNTQPSSTPDPFAPPNVFNTAPLQPKSQPAPDPFGQSTDLFNTAPAPPQQAQSDPFSSNLMPPNPPASTDLFATAPAQQSTSEANPFDMASIQNSIPAAPAPSDPFMTAPTSFSNPPANQMLNNDENPFGVSQPAAPVAPANPTSQDPFSNIMSQFATAPPAQYQQPPPPAPASDPFSSAGSGGTFGNINSQQQSSRMGFPQNNQSASGNPFL